MGIWFDLKSKMLLTHAEMLRWWVDMGDRYRLETHI